MEEFHNSLKLRTSRLISILLAGKVAILWFELCYGLKIADVFSLLEALGFKSKATLKNPNNTQKVHYHYLTT